MRRGVSIVLSVLLAVVFAAFVYYGWASRWGGPPGPEVKEPTQLSMPKMDQQLKLDPADFDHEIWKRISPVTVGMLHQVTSPPIARNLVPEVNVRAFHTDKEAYFLLEWKDDSESRIHDVGVFPDAAAIAFSLAKEPPKSSIMMGFESRVNIWQWKADRDARFWNRGSPKKSTFPNNLYTYEKKAAFPVRTISPASACQDLTGDRPGTVTAVDRTPVAGRGRWSDGGWRVILCRTLAAQNPKEDVQLGPGKFYVAFALWNGEKGDRGSRKSISDWVILNIKASGPTTAASHDPAPLPGRSALRRSPPRPSAPPFFFTPALIWGI